MSLAGPLLHWPLPPRTRPCRAGTAGERLQVSARILRQSRGGSRAEWTRSEFAAATLWLPALVSRRRRRRARHLCSFQVPALLALGQQPQEAEPEATSTADPIADVEFDGINGQADLENEVRATSAADPIADVEFDGVNGQADLENEVRVVKRKKPLVKLPIYNKYDDIKKAVEAQRVVVIVGGTGCGKTTQVPQYILDAAANLGMQANILCTQPRRLAAVSLAKRVAEERGEEVGDQIGYRIRGDVVVGEQLNFVTAGYLLSWLTVEPQAMESVTHIILDEAHERDADFELLLLLIRLMLRIYSRPRLILMSATIEAEFFATYFAEFASPRGHALEALKVGSMRYPVETFYLDDLANGKGPNGLRVPASVTEQIDQSIIPHLERFKEKPRATDYTLDMAKELLPQVAQGGTTILVFLPGYADLCKMYNKLYWVLPLDTALKTEPPSPADLVKAEEMAELEDMEDLGKVGGLDPFQTRKKFEEQEEEGKDGKDDDGEPGGTPRAYRIFALHSQVPAEDQELVLHQPPKDICHIVLATTIAESSLTLPEVSGVVDFGLHRTTAADPERPGLTSLRTQWCAHDSLQQRQGRTGRTRPGWCIRLFPKSFEETLMPPFNTPEVLRTPLTKLFLQAKGISDALNEVVEGREIMTRRLQLKARTPDELLMQLPAPPTNDSIDAAVKHLASLGVITEEAVDAQVTVLGRISLHLPLDVVLCRMVWLGGLWGCINEAIVLAAACNIPAPFVAPSPLAFGDHEGFLEELEKTAASRATFDGGHFSEPIMCLRVFQNWARRLGIASKGLIHRRKWYIATESICATEAVDPQKMMQLVNYVADVAIRVRELCGDQRGEGACKVREDIHRLICLLRRPDLNAAEQRGKIHELPPRIGEVFKAPAEKLYALLSASFSDHVLIGRHRNGPEHPMIDCLKKTQGGVASPDTIVFQPSLKKNKEDQLPEIVHRLCGERPKETVKDPNFWAVSFARSNNEAAPGWEHDSDQTRRETNLLYTGLPAAERPRLRGMSWRPRMCSMAFGGSHNITMEEGVVLQKPSAAHELSFNMASSSRGLVTGSFQDLNPLGSACHIVSSEALLGKDTFVAVAATFLVGEFSRGMATHVRINDATLLAAHQLIYLLATKEVPGMQFIFTKGPGGSKDASRAAWLGVEILGRRSRVMFQRHVPGLPTLELVNQVRQSILEAATSQNLDDTGKPILFWEDKAANAHIEALIKQVEHAPLLSELEEDFEKQSFVWVTAGEGPKAKVAALGRVDVPETVERQVAEACKSRKPVQHKYECPDCGERFMDWESCLQHYKDTCHLDVFYEGAEEEAKKLSEPILLQCPECGEGFSTWKKCQRHLESSGHLSWCKDPATRKLLCQPPDFAAVDQEEEEKEEEEKRRKKDEANRAKVQAKKKRKATEGETVKMKKTTKTKEEKEAKKKRKATEGETVEMKKTTKTKEEKEAKKKRKATEGETVKMKKTTKTKEEKEALVGALEAEGAPEVRQVVLDEAGQAPEPEAFDTSREQEVLPLPKTRTARNRLRKLSPNYSSTVVETPDRHYLCHLRTKSPALDLKVLGTSKVVAERAAAVLAVRQIEAGNLSRTEVVPLAEKLPDKSFLLHASGKDNIYSEFACKMRQEAGERKAIAKEARKAKKEAKKQMMAGSSEGKPRQGKLASMASVGAAKTEAFDTSREQEVLSPLETGTAKTRLLQLSPNYSCTVVEAPDRLYLCHLHSKSPALDLKVLGTGKEVAVKAATVLAVRQIEAGKPRTEVVPLAEKLRDKSVLLHASKEVNRDSEFACKMRQEARERKAIRQAAKKARREAKKQRRAGSSEGKPRQGKLASMASVGAAKTEAKLVDR